jgi:hypothetical protein
MRELMTGSATSDRTVQIGIVRSDLKDGQEEDGTPFKGLPQPSPVGATLTTAQVNEMVRKAIGFGGMRRGGARLRVASSDWVVILAGPGADPRVTSAVVVYLTENRRGRRITILGEGGAPGAEAVPLAKAERLELPLPGRFPKSYSIPKIVPECDRLYVVASLDSMAVGNYGALIPNPATDEALVDLYQYHTADYAIVSGTGQGRNVVFAGMNAVCVDAIAGAACGRPGGYLAILGKRGLGETDPEAIWTRGNTVDEAKEVFSRKESKS